MIAVLSLHNLFHSNSHVCTPSRLTGKTPGGGHSTFFFGGCVPRGYQNVGSREQIFLEK